MRVVVTGGLGNLGQYCLRHLVQRGHQVRCVELELERTEQAAAWFKGAVEMVWDDISTPGVMDRAVEGQDAVVHLAAIIPPESNEKPAWAEKVNVEGTRLVVEACQRAEPRPRLFFASTFDLFGYTQALPPPRVATDPIHVSDGYTAHKLANEQLISESGLRWLIARFSDMPLLCLRPAHPIMFECGLHNRFEVLHPDDGGLAIANALTRDEAWGRVLLIGGGAGCQITFREFFGELLTAMGIGPLPAEAFTTRDFAADWLDTQESQRLLQYQRHTFADIVAQVSACLGWRRYLVPLTRPFVRRSILKLSPYWRARRGTA